MLRREAGPSNGLRCAQCDARCLDIVYRCRICLHAPSLCSTCTVTTHHFNPLHVVEEWVVERGYWMRRTLGELGLVFELGHGGARCAKTLRSTRPMTVVDSHGMQDMHVRFCGCLVDNGGTIPNSIQLLEAGLWPASWDLPRTAFSLQVLREYHLLAMQAHTNALDFFNVIKHLTDDISPEEVEVRGLHCVLQISNVAITGSLSGVPHRDSGIFFPHSLSTKWGRARVRYGCS